MIRYQKSICMTDFHFPIKLIKSGFDLCKCQIAKRAFFGVLQGMDISYFTVVVSVFVASVAVVGTSVVLA